MNLTDLERSVTRSKIYLDGLTGLRGVAALWVLIYHSFSSSEHKRHLVVTVFGDDWLLTPFASAGWVGVDIFFVLSGFLLAMPFLREIYDQGEAVDLQIYAKRRLLRVLPAYYFQLILFSLAAVYLGFGVIPGWENFLSHLFMIHNFQLQHVGTINGVYWTLPIEFGFYIVLPVLFLLIKNRGIWLVLAASLIFVLAYRWGAFLYLDGGPDIHKVWLLGQLPGRLDQFMMGIVAAYIFLKMEPYWEHGKTQYLSGLLMLAGIVGLIQCLYYFTGGQFRAHFQGHVSLFVWHIIAGFFIAVLVLGIALARHWLGKIFGNPLLIYFGVISYSMYLWHLPVIHAVKQIPFIKDMETLEFPYILLIGFILTTIISSILYGLVERPFLKIRAVRQS